MKKLEKLTDKQIEEFPSFVKKWVAIGLSTEPADFDRATKAALEAYKLCNLKKPMVVLRMSSPFAATVGGALAWNMLKNIPLAQVRAQVRAQVWDQVGDQVWDQVGAQVRAQVGAQVRAQVWAQVGASINAGINNDGLSSLWCSFAAFATFFRDVCNIELSNAFYINDALVSSVGWSWWHQNVLALSDRPELIKRDAQNRLHCENGPSIKYRDGWSLYNWHGVSIPKQWVENKSSLDAKTALTWSNVEQRRAACEIVGWANILKELNAKTIDTDDEEVGTLLEVDLPDSGKERFLVVTCGTGRKGIALPVPREMETALAANLWSYGIDTVDTKYLPEVRT